MCHAMIGYCHLRRCYRVRLILIASYLLYIVATDQVHDIHVKRRARPLFAAVIAFDRPGHAETI